MTISNKLRKAIRISFTDNVATVLGDLDPGEEIEVIERDGATFSLEALDPVPFGHKVALRDLRPGDTVIKYGQSIGTVTRATSMGQHVHTHNLASDRGKAAE